MVINLGYVRFTVSCLHLHECLYSFISLIMTASVFCVFSTLIEVPTGLLYKVLYFMMKHIGCHKQCGTVPRQVQTGSLSKPAGW